MDNPLAGSTQRICLTLFVLLALIPWVSATQYTTTLGGANQSIGANNLLFLDNTNRYIGINTSSPTSMLDVYAGASSSRPVNASTEIASFTSVFSYYRGDVSGNSSTAYFGGFDAVTDDKKFYRYDIAADTLTDLAPTGAGGWLAAKNGPLTTVSAYNSTAVYFAGESGGGGLFGVYNPQTNISYDLSGTDTGNWLGSEFRIQAMVAHNSTAVYFFQSSRLGIYNPQTNISSYVSMGASFEGEILVPHNATAVYIAANEYSGYGAYFGVYNPQTGLFTNLTSTLPTLMRDYNRSIQDILVWNDTSIYVLSGSFSTFEQGSSSTIYLAQYSPVTNTSTATGISVPGGDQIANDADDDMDNVMVKSIDNTTILISQENGAISYNPTTNATSTIEQIWERMAYSHPAYLYPIGNNIYVSGESSWWNFTNTTYTQEPRLVFKNGMLGVGTTNPATTIDVKGDFATTYQGSNVVFVNSSSGQTRFGTVASNLFDSSQERALTVSGNILTTGTIYGTFADFAEAMQATEPVQPGELVASLDGLRVQKATKATAELTIGAVSTKPGLVLGNANAPNAAPIGFAGRIPVKITGDVQPGDFITISDTPGVGQAAREAGFVIGRAIAPVRPDGTVMIVIQPTYFSPQVTVDNTLIGAPNSGTFEGAPSAQTITEASNTDPVTQQAGDDVRVTLGTSQDVVFTLG